MPGRPSRRMSRKVTPRTLPGALPAAWLQGRVGDLVRLAAGGAGGAAGAVAGCLLCGVREPFEMMQWALDKARGRLKQRFA